jgi:AraC-like DNA-binding protein
MVCETAAYVKKGTHFEPHLVINEIRLPRGGEWRPHFREWCLLQVECGISYWHHRSGAREIPAGSTVVLSAAAAGTLRASQLSEVAISYFCVEAGKLLGVLSLREQHSLLQAAGREDLSVRVLPAGSPIADQFRSLRLNPGGTRFSQRLGMLQLFMEMFECEMEPDPAARRRWTDGRERLRRILDQMAASEFVKLSVSELAPMMSCSPRHLNRLFRQEIGASFLEKRTELRLAKACELLASSDAKVVEVALDSGYQSSSIFSLLFKRRYGVSPGQWRRQQLKPWPAARVHL